MRGHLLQQRMLAWLQGALVRRLDLPGLARRKSATAGTTGQRPVMQHSSAPGSETAVPGDGMQQCMGWSVVADLWQVYHSFKNKVFTPPPPAQEPAPVKAHLAGEGQQAGLAQVVLDVPHMETALGIVHLLEQLAGWLAQQRAQHVQAAPVRHSQHHLQAWRCCKPASFAEAVSGRGLYVIQESLVARQASCFSNCGLKMSLALWRDAWPGNHTTGKPWGTHTCSQRLNTQAAALASMQALRCPSMLLQAAHLLHAVLRQLRSKRMQPWQERFASLHAKPLQHRPLTALHTDLNLVAHYRSPGLSLEPGLSRHMHCWALACNACMVHVMA